ncbi:hypothetical protein RA876_18900 [Rhodoferax antarcticus]|nr:hypothetical protein RA876_18900 [Rhodoferax antarcticus]
MVAVMGMLIFWASVQTLARRFAEHNPHLGPFREERAGCGSGNCSCTSSCSSADASDTEQDCTMSSRQTLYTIQEPQ